MRRVDSVLKLKIYRYKKQYNDGALNGMTKFWYPNGQLESVEPYENGQINGNVIRYYRNGQKKARIPMKMECVVAVPGSCFGIKTVN
jgi:antitoxin component YwqK of YwqJK toxin-antitoxin module